MPNNLKYKVVVVGTGPMAVDHTLVLKKLGALITVVGRGEESALIFEQRTGIKPILGGFERYLDEVDLQSDTNIVIAVGTEMLMPLLLKLADRPFKAILIEKPGAISIAELLDNSEELTKIQDRVFLAYNRRFYSSVIESQKMIEEDGGLKSVHFEFTEWAHKVAPLNKATGVKENWFFANSTHVIDTAFYLAGKPASLSAYSKKGSIEWHEFTNFVGAGVTENDILFSYLSNWESAGRWGIELLTNNRRIYLKPLEKLYIQRKGSVELLEHQLPDNLDKSYKPGLMLQMKAFIQGDERLLTLRNHVSLTNNCYLKILSGTA